MYRIVKNYEILKKKNESFFRKQIKKNQVGTENLNRKINLNILFLAIPIEDFRIKNDIKIR